MESILDSVTRLARQYVDAADVDKLADPDVELSSLGFSSLKTVQFMLALEQTFDISFPERLLDAETFRSPRSIADAVARCRIDA